MRTRSGANGLTSAIQLNLFSALQNYIQELRSCASKELEKERVDKELGKIRKKYTSDKAMSGDDGVVAGWDT